MYRLVIQLSLLAIAFCLLGPFLLPDAVIDLIPVAPIPKDWGSPAIVTVPVGIVAFWKAWCGSMRKAYLE